VAQGEGAAAADDTRCDVPKGIFGEDSGGMLRMIAYGSELNMAYPPRPTDPKIAWSRTGRSRYA